VVVSVAVELQPAPAAVRLRQRDKLLWLMNTTRLGGSSLWVVDAIDSMPNWRHEVLFVHGPEEHPVAEELRAGGTSVSQAPRITKAMVDAIAPSVVVLSNTDPAALDGEHPWAWLMSGWPVVSVHHSPVWPWLEGAIADVFVSQHLFAMYGEIAGRMRRALVIPPGIRTAEFAAAPRPAALRPAAGGRCIIGRHSSGDARKYPAAQLDILRAVGQPAVIVGGADHYGAADGLFSFPPIGAQKPADFLSGIDVFVYRSDTTETWCRAVTEAMASGLPCVADARGGIAEQIEDGVTGFLCGSDAEFIDRLQLLVRNPALRFEMGMRARVSALVQFDVRRFRDELEPLLLRAAGR
jgi:glycosyltransferase involved in cell wall biosynthesis